MRKLLVRAVSYTLSLVLHVLLGEEEPLSYDDVPDTTPRTPPPSR